MAMFNVDFKRWLPINGLGPNDLKLYGEASVLGVKDYGNLYNDIWQRIPVMMGFNIPTFGWLDYLSLEVEWYGSPYRNSLGKIGNFNSLSQPGVSPFPVEPLSDSLSPNTPSPVPMSYDDYYKNATDQTWIDAHQGHVLDSLGRLVLRSGDTLQVKGTAWDVENLMTDNWKWSLYLEKTVHSHISFMAQVANDHFRPRPVATPINEYGGMAEAFSSPRDWYFMFRVGYFF